MHPLGCIILRSVRTNDVRKFLTKNKTHNSDAHFLIIKLSNYVKGVSITGASKGLEIGEISTKE